MNQWTNVAQDAAKQTSKVVETNASWLEAYIGTGPFAFVVKMSGALIVVVVMIMLSKFVAMIVKNNILKHSVIEDEKNSGQIAGLIGDIVYYSLVIFSIFVGFQILGFDVGLILWWVSFGIGLAFKEVLGNMIAGIMILTTKELKLWDVIEVDGTYFGRIEEITVRYTTIRTVDLRQVVLPNTTLISTAIKTYSAEESVKLKSNIGVHYDTDLEFASKVIIQAINSLPFIKDGAKKTKVYVTNFWDSAIELSAFYYVDPLTWLVPEYAMGEVNQRINEYLKSNNIVIPYPHTTLTVDKNDKALLGTMLFGAKAFTS